MILGHLIEMNVRIERIVKLDQIERWMEVNKKWDCKTIASVLRFYEPLGLEISTKRKVEF